MPVMTRIRLRCDSPGCASEQEALQFIHFNGEKWVTAFSFPDEVTPWLLRSSELVYCPACTPAELARDAAARRALEAKRREAGAEGEK